MTIVVTGAGSGGHITPILAVAHELKQLRPDTQIIYIGQKGDGLGDVPGRSAAIDQVLAVSAGKYRRYHGEGFRQLLDVKTVALNIRDAFKVIAGIFQSWRLLRRLRPEVVFIKGGFVGVPVGVAAHWLKIPFITHDSDAIPGLANRIIGRWAAKHAVAMPAEVYDYPPAKTVTVGIPLVREYQYVTPEAKADFRRELQLDSQVKVLFIIGGGLGAQRINKAMVQALPALLASFPDLQVIHGVGRANETDMTAQYAAALTAEQGARVQVKGFLHDVYKYSGAADVIVTRAGATNLAEFAVQGKACVVIPSPFLAGGHQLKNAAYLVEKKAAAIIDEVEVSSNPDKLQKLLCDLLSDPARQAELGSAFTQFGHPDAATKLAKLILNEATVTSA